MVLSAISISFTEPALGSLIVKLAFNCIVPFIPFNIDPLIVLAAPIIKVPSAALLLLKVRPPRVNLPPALTVPEAATFAKTRVFIIASPCKLRVLPAPPLHCNKFNIDGSGNSTSYSI